jgi:hypothetical protein
MRKEFVQEKNRPMGKQPKGGENESREGSGDKIKEQGQRE